MIDRLLAIVAPHSCYDCGEIGSVLCEHCLNNIKEDPFSRCLFCHRLTASGALCRSCADRYQVEMAWCVGARRGVLKALVDAYKFERVKAADRTLAKLLHESTPLLTDNVVVTCVPTASSHIRVRGYDHAERVAREFAKLRALPYRSMLERTSGETQHFATRRERFAQAGNAFRRKESAESVLLIDDILTTGASLLAAVRILREGGARKVYLGVIARQPLDELDDL